MFVHETLRQALGKLCRLSDGVARWPSSYHGVRPRPIHLLSCYAPLLQKHHDCFARSLRTHGSIKVVCGFCAIKSRRVALLTSSRGFKYQLAENIGPQQCPLSAHSVPTQCPHSAHTVPTAIYWHIRMQEFNTKNFFLAFPNITVKCNGHCVGTEWALSGH